MADKTIAVELAHLATAIMNCRERGNTEWEARHMERAESLVSEYLPSGGGFDNGTTFVVEKSTAVKLVFKTSFHHMAESGMYDGWTEHTVTVTPSFVSHLDVAVSGKNRNDIKSYIGEMFANALEQTAPPETAAV